MVRTSFSPGIDRPLPAAGSAHDLRAGRLPAFLAAGHDTAEHDGGGHDGGGGHDDKEKDKDKDKKKETPAWSPFSFKMKPGEESELNIAYVNAELSAGASFALKISTSLAACPCSVAIEWSPKLPGGAGKMLIGGAVAGLAGLIAGVTALAGSGKSSGSTDMASQISAHLALVATAAALIAAQKDITFSANMPLLLEATVHPMLVGIRKPGKAMRYSALETRSKVFEWENARSHTNAALGIVGNHGARDQEVGSGVHARGMQLRLAGDDGHA